MTAASFAPAASADDAQESSAGTMNLTNTVQNSALDATGEWAGVRFRSVTIPKGAVITSAFLQLVPDAGAGVGDDPDVTIYGQAADNAGAFTSSTNDISSRSRTTASVNWAATGLGQDAYVNSADISTIIQEIVDRSGWAAGNALVILLTTRAADANRDLRFYMYDNGSNYPLLAVTFYKKSYHYRRACSPLRIWRRA